MLKTMKMLSLVLFAVAITACTTTSKKEVETAEIEKTKVEKMEEVTNEVVWDKTFPKSEKVDHKKVSYPNRFGITISADMYMPKDIAEDAKYPALIVGTPYGGVKEQGAGIYAQEMAERGFVAIAFDESFNGESGGIGNVKELSSPEIFVEDFSAGVDFLGTRDFVDREKIGVIGICGSGGFALTAAQADTRIKAVATASMYDISSMIHDGLFYSLTNEQREQMKKQLSEQRWKDFENKTQALPPVGFPPQPLDAVPEGLDPITSEFFEYYATERGWHPNTVLNFTLTSSLAFMNFPLMAHLEEISPRPILMIAGENAHSLYYTEEAYAKAAEPKELVIIPEARHIDLYDRKDVIPFDKLESFFKENLK